VSPSRGPVPWQLSLTFYVAPPGAKSGSNVPRFDFQKDLKKQILAIFGNFFSLQN
jgi:hypothetical protein